MKSLFLSLSVFFLLLNEHSFAQGWQPGTFYDVKGNTETGLIKINANGKGPVKDEASIDFKENKKANSFTLSASDLKAFVVGRDSFVVAAAPPTADWRNYLDFVRVAFDEGELKLFVFKGNAGGGSGIQPDFGIGAGAGVGGGGGGFGGGIGGGISIPIGGGGRSNKVIYYYGANTAGMKLLTSANFVDIMSEMMGDEPEIVDQLHQRKYNLGNIDKLLANYWQLQASHGGQPASN